MLNIFHNIFKFNLFSCIEDNFLQSKKISDLHENGYKVNAIPPKTKAKLLTGFLVFVLGVWGFLLHNLLFVTGLLPVLKEFFFFPIFNDIFMHLSRIKSFCDLTLAVNVLAKPLVKAIINQVPCTVMSFMAT